MDTFGVPPVQFSRPDSLLAFARTVGQLVSAGYLVALDEFQYFSRKLLSEFTSHSQGTVDELSARAEAVPGGSSSSGHFTRNSRYRDWRLERVAIAPKIDRAVRASLEANGVIPQDLTDLVQGL
jgi:hypothetical protein